MESQFFLRKTLTNSKIVPTRGRDSNQIYFMDNSIDSVEDEATV